MGVGDPIAQNGTYELRDNLQVATGISDDRLSAHHPNGAGNQTKMSDFVIKAVGYDPDQDSQNYVRKLEPESLSGSWSGGWFVLSGGDLQNGDTFTVRVHVHNPGDHAIEQILKETTSFPVQQSGNCTLLSRTDVGLVRTLQHAIDLKFEVTGYNSVTAEMEFKGHMNHNADNTGTAVPSNFSNSVGVIFRTQDVESDTVLIDTWHVWVRDDGSNVHFDFNVDGSDNNLGESFVVRDPAGKENAFFRMYENSGDIPSNDYASDEEPDFLSQNHFEQTVSDFQSSPGGRAVQFYCEIEDQNGNRIDVVTFTVDESDTGTWGSTESCYEYTTSTTRSQGTHASPVTMNYNGSC